MHGSCTATRLAVDWNAPCVEPLWLQRHLTDMHEHKKLADQEDSARLTALLQVSGLHCHIGRAFNVKQKDVTCAQAYFRA